MSVVIFAALAKLARPAARGLVRWREIAERKPARAADTFDRKAKVLHQAVDESDLRAILHGGVHDAVGHVAAVAVATRNNASAPTRLGRAIDTRHAVDLKDLDRLDVFH